jgi:hypothetical protein
LHSCGEPWWLYWCRRRCSALLYTWLVSLPKPAQSRTFPHWQHSCTLSPFSALLMRPVLVRMGAEDRFDILTLSAGRWRDSLLEGRRWGPVMSGMVEDLLEDLGGRGAFDPRGRSCRSGIEFAGRGRDGSSSSELATMLDGGQYLLYIPLGADQVWWEDPKRGVVHKPVRAQTGEGPNLGSR